VRPSILPSVLIGTALTEGISFKLNIGDTYENMSRKYEFGLNGANVLDISLQDVNSLLLPAALNRHKSAPFECNGVRLSG